jgi:hypothetical protein
MVLAVGDYSVENPADPESPGSSIANLDTADKPDVRCPADFDATQTVVISSY